MHSKYFSGIYDDDLEDELHYLKIDQGGINTGNPYKYLEEEEKRSVYLKSSRGYIEVTVSKEEYESFTEMGVVLDSVRRRAELHK